MKFLISHYPIFLTVCLGVYGQCVMRFHMKGATEIPENLLDKIFFLISQFLNPWIFSVLVATFLGGLSWMLTLSRFEVSYAYPFLSLNLILVTILGVIFFSEAVSPQKIIGVMLVFLGVLLITRSSGNASTML